MAILEEDIARVRQAADLIEIVSEHIGLKKSGRRWMGLCPFHGERTPSFSVNAEEGIYYCFGCQAKGDVITFVREIEHLDFVGAVERLAGRYKIELRYDSTAATNERRRRNKLVEAMKQAEQWYHERLVDAQDARTARAYLRERGYDSEIVRRFRIGWAPDSWDELARALKLPDKVLADTGLGFVNRSGRTQDSFRARLLFPVFDVAGDPVAFGGRKMPGADGPKYKNSSETALYSKSRVLYGLNWAKEEIVAKNEVIVCEGYTDVIGFFQAGINRAVATCGTALTDQHVRILKNFASKVVLAYDADGAGQAAAERFYEWERSLQIDIRVIALPKGADPGDAARSDPALLAKAVDEARPFLAFRIERALEKADLRSIEGRARAAELCIEMIREHPNEMVRDQYVMLVSDRCRISPEQLRGQIDGTTAVKPNIIDVRPVQRTPVQGDISRTEWEALLSAVQQPEIVGTWLDEMLDGRDVADIEDALFTDLRSQAAFRCLAESPTLRDAFANAEPEAADVLGRLAVDGADTHPPDEFVRIIDQASTRAIRSLERLARSGSEDALSAGTDMAWMKLTVEKLRNASTTDEAAALLIGWLIDHRQRVA